MALKGIEMGLLLALTLTLLGGATAQSGCTKVLMGLSPCLNYVTRNSSTPSSSCCSQLSTVVQTQPQCLCLLLNGSAASMGYNINQTIAIALPGVRNVQTPSISLCNDMVSFHIVADSSNETAGTQTTPSVPSVPSGTKTVPTTGSTSDGFAAKLPLHLTIFILFVTTYASNVISF